MLSNDPMLLKELRDAHLAELRSRAATRRAIHPSSMSAWRTIAGRAMLCAALRLLGEPGTGPIADPSRTADNV